VRNPVETTGPIATGCLDFAGHYNGFNMSTRENNLWHGIDPATQKALSARDYRSGSFAQKLSEQGLNATEILGADRNQRELNEAWIPGVEVFARKIHPQRHRGFFGEFVRRDEGVLSRIGLWPKQWSAARMFANTAKGFHVHPPSIPEGSAAADWLRRLFIDQPDNYSLRRYDDEQWDVMFFLQGRVEMILCDVRAGLPRRVMHFFIDGDNHPGNDNAGVVIPPGVAHAIRVEGSEDLMMVYGTSTIFHPEFEGRIASEIENAELPESWQRFLGESGKQEITK
jgi:dTDP-4-dehydrorhamnose 3,5-epimerase-like enzyme